MEAGVDSRRAVGRQNQFRPCGERIVANRVHCKSSGFIDPIRWRHIRDWGSRLLPTRAKQSLGGITRCDRYQLRAIP